MGGRTFTSFAAHLSQHDLQTVVITLVDGLWSNVLGCPAYHHLMSVHFQSELDMASRFLPRFLVRDQPQYPRSGLQAVKSTVPDEGLGETGTLQLRSDEGIAGDGAAIVVPARNRVKRIAERNEGVMIFICTLVEKHTMFRRSNSEWESQLGKKR